MPVALSVVFLKKLGENGDVYGQWKLLHCNRRMRWRLRLPDSVDLALAFRNVHSWLRADQAEVMFTVIADTLKPGGVLGIVQHRGDAGLSLDQMKKHGLCQRG